MTLHTHLPQLRYCHLHHCHHLLQFQTATPMTGLLADCLKSHIVFVWVD